MNLRKIRRVVQHAVSVLLVPFVAVATAIRVLPYLDRLRKAAGVFVPDRKLNFGNSVRQADTLRQVFYPDPTVFLIWTEPYHNPYIRTLWSDLTYVSLRRTALDLMIRGRRLIVPEPEVHDWVAATTIKFLVRILNRRNVALVNRDELTALIPMDPILLAQAEEAHAKNPEELFLSLFQNASYCRPSLKHRCEPVRLPRDLAEGVYRRLRELWGAGGALKLATVFAKIYSPINGDGGPPIEEYELAIRELVSHDYQVLVVGDHEVPWEIIHRYGGKVVDWRYTGMDKRLFTTFAQTECDIYLAAGGAGNVFCNFIKAPSLIFSLYPFYSNTRQAVQYYSRAVAEDGRVLSLPEIVECLRDGSWRRLRIEYSSAEEIHEALADFLEWVEHGCEDAASIELAKCWPAYSPFHLAGCRLSPAYTRRYGRPAGVPHKSTQALQDVSLQPSK